MMKLIGGLGVWWPRGVLPRHMAVHASIRRAAHSFMDFPALGYWQTALAVAVIEMGIGFRTGMGKALEHL